MSISRTLVVVAFLLGPVAVAGAQSATQVGERAFFRGLGDLPGGPFRSYVRAVSADGTTAVGLSRSAPDIGFQPVWEAFLWTRERGLVGLGDLDGGVVRSDAMDVSADGSVIVGTTDSVAFRWTSAAGMAPLRGAQGDFPDMRPFAVSADGSVVFGSALDLQAGGNVSARWTAATGIVHLGALPNALGFPDAYLWACSGSGSVATGNSFGAFVQPTRWTPGTGLLGLGDVPGGFPYALGEGVSGDGGTIVGSARTDFDQGSRDEAFVWSADTGFRLLDPDRGELFYSVAYACSADGRTVVGGFGGVGGAMVWDERHGMRGIADLLTDRFGLDLGGWVLGSAQDVSADGTIIVGNGINPGGESEAWIARLPATPMHPIQRSGFLR